MGKASNQITLIDDAGETALPLCGKDETAAAIVRRIAELLSAC